MFYENHNFLLGNFIISHSLCQGRYNSNLHTNTNTKKSVVPVVEKANTEKEEVEVLSEVLKVIEEEIVETKKEVKTPIKPIAQPVKKSNCHPSYSGACLKTNAGDYDCAGGSGNGPNYTGTVRVVGPDVFGLDRDNDGWGCE